mmetsp:Transcript_18852/g.43305  ORF Transcript_18852/g.43305 Transcript_18852/m.43305 type:complete len:228 (+) Transcript_18852:194-877(+)
MRPLHLRAHPKVLHLHHFGHRRLVANVVLARRRAEILRHDGPDLGVARLVLILEVGALVVVLLQELPLLLLGAVANALLIELLVLTPALIVGEVTPSLELRRLALRLFPLVALALEPPELAQLPCVELLQLIRLVLVVRHVRELERALLPPKLVLAHNLDEHLPRLDLPLLHPLGSLRLHLLLLQLLLLPLLDSLSLGARDEDRLEHHAHAASLCLLLRVRLVLRRA